MDPMARALELARAALGRTSPNPTVGAVVVKDGEIIGEGFHPGAGGPHAEVVALRQAGERARGATLYVTLEPCSHYGRTPPCVDEIIRAGVAMVRYAMDDPDPQAGGGRAKLEAAGVRVVAGEREAEARRLNEAYVKHRTSGLPFVIAKFAASLDGKIAAVSGDSRWISGPEAREWAQTLRSQVDAILVGAGTVIMDDPALTARPGGELAARQPLRVVVDSGGRTPANARMLGPGAMVATTDQAPAPWREQVREGGSEVLVLPAGADGSVPLRPLLETLGRRGILSLLVEGGGVILGSFVDAGLVDKVHAVIAPVIIGGPARMAVEGRGATRMSQALRLRQVTVDRLGDDVLITGYPGER